MKKLLIGILLISVLFSVAGLPVASAEPGEIITTTQDAEYIVKQSSSQLALSIENGLFKVVAGTNAGTTPYAASIVVNGSPNKAYVRNIKVKEYPIIAFKVKLNDKNSEFGNVTVATSDTWDIREKLGGTGIAIYPLTANGTYKQTNDWQLVITDISNDNNYTKYTAVNGENRYWVTDNSVYNSITIHLLNREKQGTANDIFYIEWIGFFKTAEDAQAYYDPSSVTTQANTTQANTTQANTTTGAPSTTSPKTSDIFAWFAAAVVFSLTVLAAGRRRNGIKKA